MRLYLTAKTSIPDLFIDYIQVKLKSGEEVSLNWDYSDIERTSSDRKSTRLNSSHRLESRMPSSA